MDFKHLNSDKNKTPNSKNKYFVGKVLSCDSPFRLLPNYSTPPSTLTKIVNPFEAHWRERLHLPTFSPNVFAQASTPKTDEGFKWSIEDISNLKPAQIDENTVSQHIVDEDPVIESVVQEKINRFFSEKDIVPSPMNMEVKTAPLINMQSPATSEKTYSEGIAQTILTLPPILPKHIEDALKPFFTYTQDQQQNNSELNTDSTVYRNLFASPSLSLQSSPPMSTGFSPIEFSPISSIVVDKVHDGSLSSISEIPEIDECNLSPINCSRNPSPQSVRRLNFSEHMSVDASMIVPDINNENQTRSICLDEQSLSVHESLSNSSVNWDMEYNHVSILSPNKNTSLKMMDISNQNTPNSRMFTSQRKRLSESFKTDDEFMSKENFVEDNEYIGRRTKSRLFEDDLTDAGYQTGGLAMTDESSAWQSTSLFASTPSKKQ